MVCLRRRFGGGFGVGFGVGLAFGFFGGFCFAAEGVGPCVCTDEVP